MSKYVGGIVYIIVPGADAADNYEMLNASTSTSFEYVRKNTGSSKYIFAVNEPVPKVFSQYRWYSIDEIKEQMVAAEWAQT